MKVLVVADEPWVVNDVRAALSDRRWSLEVLEDPRRVADRVSEEPFDIVLADLQVGSMGGMAVARAVRGTSTGGPNAPPVILLLDREADSFLAGRAGAVAWIRKPFSAADLRRAIDAAAAAPAR